VTCVTPAALALDSVSRTSRGIARERDSLQAAPKRQRVERDPLHAARADTECDVIEEEQRAGNAGNTEDD